MGLVNMKRKHTFPTQFNLSESDCYQDQAFVAFEVSRCSLPTIQILHLPEESIQRKKKKVEKSIRASKLVPLLDLASL